MPMDALKFAKSYANVRAVLRAFAYFKSLTIELTSEEIEMLECAAQLMEEQQNGKL